MSKQINFQWKNGKTYCLEFTRDSVVRMERAGFIARELNDKPMSMLPDLFAGAFLANHRYEKRAVIDEIFNSITNRAELMGKLSEMYNEPMQALLDDAPAEETEGNVTWTANF